MIIHMNPGSLVVDTIQVAQFYVQYTRDWWAKGETISHREIATCNSAAIQRPGVHFGEMFGPTEK